MVSYSNGKIYKIVPKVESEIHEVYYGSTTKKYLSQRMVSHRSNYNLWKNNKYGHVRVFNLFDKYDIENCEIILVETFNCNSKDELLSREKFYIQNNPCLNKAIPIRTNDERKQIKKESGVIYREKNKDEIKIYKTEYREKNKATIKAKQKEYREKNDIQLKAKKNAKCNCICGVCYANANKSRHLKSKKHQDFINQNEI